MSEKKNSLEEKRILQKKLQWYTLEAEDGEFNATEVEAMLERLDELESLPEKEDGADFSEPKDCLLYTSAPWAKMAVTAAVRACASPTAVTFK